MKFKKFLSAMFVTVAMATPVLAGCQKGGNSTSADPGTSTSVDPGPGPVQNEYVIAVEGNARVGEKVTFVLKKGNSPATLEVTFSLKNAADSEYLAFEDGAVAECKKEGKVTVVAKKADGTVVAELELTIAKSSVLTIKEALTEAIKEAPCNGSAGKNAAQTASSFTFAGRIVAIPKSGNSDASKYDGTILIDDGEEIVAVLVYGDAAKLTAKVGDSVQLTAKFTNYYGILEAIHPSSIAGEKQSSFYPDQLTVIDRKFTAQKTQLMDADGFKAYYAEAKANGTSGATKYTSIKPVKLQKVEETGETGSNYKTFKVNGDTSECNGKLSITDTLACEAENEQGKFSNIEGYMVGGNSSSKYLKMTITKQENVAPEKAKITCASGELVVGPGSKLQLMLDLQPAGSAVNGVKWYSLNEAIATVDEDTGLVTGVSVGYVGIRAVVDGMMFPVFTMVRVDNNPAVEVRLDKTEAQLINVEGESVTLSATAIGKKATSPCGEEVVWESNNENIAKVENGVVTPVGPGQAIITARAGYAHATCVVTIRDQKLKDLEDGVYQQKANVYGYYVGGYENGDVAGFWIADGDVGMYIYAKPSEVNGTLEPGAVLHVKGAISNYNGGKQITPTKNVKVEVVGSRAGLQAPTKLALDSTKVGNLTAKDQGRLCTLKGIVTSVPKKAVYGTDNCTYTISLSKDKSINVYMHKSYPTKALYDDAFAKLVKGKEVEVEGYLSAYKSKATDLSTVGQGDYQLLNAAVVSAKDPTITAMSLSATALNIEKGKSSKLETVFEPYGAISTDVVWSVTGNDKVTVDQTGKVSVASNAAVGSKATVKATLGSLSATCEITVTGELSNVNDDFTSASFTATSTSYAYSTVKNTASGAEYYAQTNLASNGIFSLRGTKPSGIMTTKSGGLIRKVTIVVPNSYNTARVVDIYVSHTAFTSLDSLYETNSYTKAGSISYAGDSTKTLSFEITGDYEFVAIRVNKSAFQLSKVTFTWAQ